jgi:hypothetical protein
MFARHTSESCKCNRTTRLRRGSDIDLLEIDFRLSNGFLVIVLIDQRVEIAWEALSFLHSTLWMKGYIL